MPRNKILNLLKPPNMPPTTQIGAAGYDNARENIDPHVKTKVLNTKEGSVQKVPVNDFDLANKKYVDDNSTSPAGNDTEIQFNDSSSFGASSSFVWSGTELVISGDGVGNGLQFYESATEDVQLYSTAGDLYIEPSGNNIFLKSASPAISYLSAAGSQLGVFGHNGSAMTFSSNVGYMNFINLHNGRGMVFYPDNTITQFTQKQNTRFYGRVGIGKFATSGVELDVVGDTHLVGLTEIGDGTNFTNFEGDGTLHLTGSATGWDDLRVPVNSVKRLGFSDPSWSQFIDDGSGSTGVYALEFSQSTKNEVFFSAQLPHGWKEGSDIEPHVHWSPNGANSGNTVWFLEYTWANIDGTFGNTTTISVEVASDGVDKKHQLASFPSISAAGKTISSILVCRLYRDGGQGDDDLATGTFLHEIDFHYEIDTIGSRQEFIK